MSEPLTATEIRAKIGVLLSVGPLYTPFNYVGTAVEYENRRLPDEIMMFCPTPKCRHQQS